MTAQVAAVKSDIKFVTEGIKELLQLTGWDESATGRGT